MNKSKAIEVKRTLEEAKEMIPYMIEFETQKAVIVKARYDSLINSGFSKDQAIEICKDGYK